MEETTYEKPTIKKKQRVRLAFLGRIFQALATKSRLVLETYV